MPAPPPVVAALRPRARAADEPRPVGNGRASESWRLPADRAGFVLPQDAASPPPRSAPWRARSRRSRGPPAGRGAPGRCGRRVGVSGSGCGCQENETADLRGGGGGRGSDQGLVHGAGLRSRPRTSPVTPRSSAAFTSAPAGARGRSPSPFEAAMHECARSARCPRMTREARGCLPCGNAA